MGLTEPKSYICLSSKWAVCRLSDGFIFKQEPVPGSPTSPAESAGAACAVRMCCSVCMSVWESQVSCYASFEQHLKKCVEEEFIKMSFTWLGPLFAFSFPAQAPKRNYLKRKGFYLDLRFQKYSSMARKFHCCSPETRLKHQF